METPLSCFASMACGLLTKCTFRRAWHGGCLVVHHPRLGPESGPLPSFYMCLWHGHTRVSVFVRMCVQNLDCHQQDVPVSDRT